MLFASLPIAVVMQRRTLHHRWADAAWSAVGVVPNTAGLTAHRTLDQDDQTHVYLVPGLALELHRDENDGYFENWAAPQPKVFIMWRMQNELAIPVTASVSYGEGTRMLDSGECGDGVAMPPEIYQWLTDYLQAHYQPPERSRRVRT
jgi:hypothetical protein